MKIPSPCISVCKFKNAGHCVGCGMTKKQKKKFKRLEGRKKKLRFIEALRIQQQEVALKANWERAYRRRCRKKGVDCPLDAMPVHSTVQAGMSPTAPVPTLAPVPEVDRPPTTAYQQDLTDKRSQEAARECGGTT